MCEVRGRAHASISAQCDAALLKELLIKVWTFSPTAAPALTQQVSFPFNYSYRFYRAARLGSGLHSGRNSFACMYSKVRSHTGTKNRNNKNNN